MTKVTPSKDDLERQKLALEIRELQRKWWQRPVYLSILLPIVLASLTVLAGILSGYFDRERRELNRNIQALKSQNTALLETQSAIRQASSDAEQRLREINQQYEQQSKQLQELGQLFSTLSLDAEGVSKLRGLSAEMEADRNPRTTPLRRSKPEQKNSSPRPSPSN